MNKRKPICVYDYVNKSYKEVREQLIWKGLEIFSRATRTVASHFDNLKPELHADFGGFGASAEISTKIGRITETGTSIGRGRVTSIELEWEAARMPRLFPLMKAELLVYPLTAIETQLELSGKYEPPFGLLGSAVDDIAGYRIAETSCQQFITDIAVYLRNVAEYSTAVRAGAKMGMA